MVNGLHSSTMTIYPNASSSSVLATFTGAGHTLQLSVPIMAAVLLTVAALL